MNITSYGEIRSLLRQLPVAPRRRTPALVCGPCAIETPEQLESCARIGKRLGAVALRGGAFKLRTSVESFHGLGLEGWEMLRAVSAKHDLASISEVTSVAQMAAAKDHLDYVQIGARSMWNFELLEAAAKLGLPVVLKRGLGASTADWINAAIRLSSCGAQHLILCERGMPALGWPSRNAVDISTLLMLALESPVPFWLDVSHSAGERSVVVALLQHARSLPVDAVMVEVHPDPARASCDAQQAIDCADLERAWA